jgi:hypothetical protein
MNRYATWVFHMRISIQAASIARQSWDRMREGHGPPNVDDMRAFSEEGAALAELWEESLAGSDQEEVPRG